MICKWVIFTCVLLLGQTATAGPIIPKAEVATELIILHNNDMHARFEQTDANGEKCTPEEANTNECYGGFARVAYEVRKYRAEAEKGGTPTLYLNSGDTYTGTPWFTIFKDNITAAFLNKLQPDAISLGNHEFDNNVQGLVPFLNNVKFPVLACNLDVSKEPELAAAKNFAKSTILESNGVQIGVIGYLTPDTKLLTYKNGVEFNEEIVSINAEAAKLTAQGIKIIIALGHSGYQKDQEIAKNCPEIDIVIGGHSHSFLFGNESATEYENGDTIKGPYPTVVQQGGKLVPVVQAYAYTKYLGKLHVQFDAAGNLIEFDGTPMLLNASVEREQDLVDLLDVYRPNITALDTDILGYTKVTLEGGFVCRQRECNLGNMITDSMVFARVKELEGKGGSYWTDAPIALLQGGGIRSSIKKMEDGSIVGSDILAVIPFENDLFITRISGKTLRNALEHSATVRNWDSSGGFLQFSGIHVEYSYDEPEGQRVVSAEVRCAECDVPTYSALNDSDYYNVIVPQFLLEGGDAFVLAEENNPVSIHLAKNDMAAIVQYLQSRQFVYPEMEGRIKFKESEAILGYTKVYLEGGEACSERECNTGNMVTDAMVLARVLEYEGGDFWTDAPIALIEGGDIQPTIVQGSNGSISATDILVTVSSGNALYVTRITGRTLRNALEHSATLSGGDLKAGFLQIAGIRVEYSFEKAEGQRVASVLVRCANCNVPYYSILNDTAYYNVIVTQSLLEGRDGYVFTEVNDPVTVRLQKDDQAALSQYLERRHFVYPEWEDRIVFRGSAASIIGSIALIVISSLVSLFFK